MSHLVAVGDLSRAARQALEARGMPAAHAAWVAESLVETSQRGIDTHGIRLLPTYLAELEGGRCRADPRLEWSGDGAVRVLDAGGALGVVAGRLAAEEAADLAALNGVGAVAVRGSNHFGAASCHTLVMARRGCLGIAATNSDALVAPAGGRAPLFGTNPISYAVHGEGEDVLCADFTTSQGSFLKVRTCQQEGRPAPPGWAVDGEGRDLAEGEPGRPFAALLPLGGHKGQCLGMMVELLTALLAGGPFDHELMNLYDEPYAEPREIAHFFLALQVAAFQDPAAFRARVSRLLAAVREQPGIDGGEVLAPGDPEARIARRRSGRIPLEPQDLAALTACGLDLTPLDAGS